MKKSEGYKEGIRLIESGQPDEALEVLYKSCHAGDPLSVIPLLQLLAFKGRWQECIDAFKKFGKNLMKVIKQKDGRFDLVWYDSASNVLKLAVANSKSDQDIIAEYRKQWSLPEHGFRVFSNPRPSLDQLESYPPGVQPYDDKDKKAAYEEIARNIHEHMPPYDKKNQKQLEERSPSYKFMFAQRYEQHLTAMALFFEHEQLRHVPGASIEYIMAWLIREGKTEQARAVLLDWAPHCWGGMLEGELLPIDLLENRHIAPALDAETREKFLRVPRLHSRLPPVVAVKDGSPIRTLRIKMSPAKAKITEPVTKFGGQPVWIDDPQWPVSASTGKQLHFIGQIRIDPDVFGQMSAQMAYIFMNNSEEAAGESADPDSGENAVILQPGLKNTAKIIAAAEGPTCGADQEVKLTAGKDKFINDLDEYEYDEIEPMTEDKIGGMPIFVQGDLFDEPWHKNYKLLLQLDDDQEGLDANFGTGTAFAFIAKDGKTAKFLWQC